MGKRFRDTEIWNEDWYLSLGDAGMLFWDWISDHCDHAGIWRPNYKPFELSTGRRINPTEWLQLANADRDRVRLLDNGRWWLIGFVRFQYGRKLNDRNRVHMAVMELLTKNGIPPESTGCEIDHSLTSTNGQSRVNHTLKEKEKEKDKRGCGGTSQKVATWLELGSVELRAAWGGFLEMRQRIRKPATVRAQDMIVAKLEAMAPGNVSTQIDILNQSTLKSWQDIWPIRGQSVEPPLPKLDDEVAA